MRAVDKVVLPIAEAIPGLDVHDGLMLPPYQIGTPVVITYHLPYAVYSSSVGDDPEDSARLSGRTVGQSTFFSFMYVGISPDQAKLAGEKLQAAFKRKRLVVPGFRTGLVLLEESQRVRRDDDAIRPGGEPLFYGVDNYALFITPHTT